MIAALAPEAIGFQLPTHVRMMKEVTVVAISQAAAGEASPPPVISQDKPAVGSDSTVVLRASYIAKWTAYTETLFQQLVNKRADGTLSPEQRVRLAKLRQDRERLASPVPAEQILRDFRARQLRREALEAMRKYADFLEKSARKETPRPRA